MLTKNKDTLLAPILTSILDTDAYKLHMQQAVFHRYPEATVAAEFRCRSDDKLGQYTDIIQHQVNLMHDLRLTDEEADYLISLPFFKPDYLKWLKSYRYNPALVKIENKNGELAIRIEGLWLDTILWEVPLLAVISEVVHQCRTPQIGVTEAIEKLEQKLIQFRHETREIDLSYFNLMDFGTRRRYSRNVQTAVVKYLKEHFPGFKNTSNYHLAYKLGLTPEGTQAHEWFQAHQQLVPDLIDFQRAALAVWLEEYPNHLSIALTDCISMDAFLRDFDHNFALRYNGLRHDSGDPIVWGEKAIAHYEQLGIDPKDKVLVFSDSLTFPKALRIYRHFCGRATLSFGMGSHLTCDLPITPTLNTKTLNIVIKLIECNGKPVAKLSDSPGKTIAEDQEFIHRLKTTFGVPEERKHNNN